ncbi:MAG: phosphoglucosamine mutase [bacterium]
MRKLFGTDGVRGVANQKLTAELAFQIGRAGAYLLTAENKRGRIVIGKDTRISGDMLEAALIAGITSLGVDVLAVGVISTPAIAYLTRDLKADAGIVISASHNPVEDNGIKFFAGNGFKLPDEKELELERLIFDPPAYPQPVGGDIGRVLLVDDAKERYIKHAKETIKESLAGLKIVVDGANGAASEIAPRILRDLGAEVITINCAPDGKNINDGCGSTHPESLQQAVLEEKADLGLAHDGDADRIIAVDENGNLIDGDFIMTICGKHLASKGKLKNNLLVVTVMTNLGLKIAFQDTGVQLLETKVGDRYVLEAMREKGACLGGEQSGHIIFLEHNTTGDGIITALQLLSVMQEKKQSLGTLAGQMKKLPQVLINVRTEKKDTVMDIPEVAAAIKQAEEKMAGRGRILIRPSGTEPLLRIMAEGEDQKELQLIGEAIADVIRQNA